MKKLAGIFVLLVVLCVVTALLNPRFLSHGNLLHMANLIGLYGIFSLGVGLVIISGGIDLSVGSMLALAGMLLVLALTEWHWPWPLALLMTVGVGGALGLAHGVLVARFRLQSFIVTLCGLLLYRGIARFISADVTKGFGSAEGFEGLRDAATGNFFGVPAPFVFLALISAGMWVILHRSVYGRHLFATGRAEEAARFSGINTRWIIASTYVISGLLAGTAAILFAFYTNSISPSTHGSFYELYGVAAAVLGGCSLSGGEGSVLGILLGTALLQVLSNLVNLLGIPSSLDLAVMGAVVLIGALADQLLRKKQ